MTIQEIINISIKKLKTSSASPELDSEVLLSHIFRKPKSYLFVHMHKCVPQAKQRKFFSLITKRQKGWPVAYLIGKKEFYGLDFQVNKNVLIPRCETETLVDLVLEKFLNSKFEIPASPAGRRNSKLSILDLGTGSGCIIISLAKKISTLHPNPYPLLSASDISSQALKIAKQNAHQHKVKIKFKQGNLLKPWKKQHFDIIVANLPYGWKEWKNDISAETVGLKFEPLKALFTKERGLYLYKKLFEQIRGYSQIRPFADSIFVEFDPRQTRQIKKLAEKFLPDFLLEIKKDFAGKNRFACLSPHYLL
jgi:release factor glutamine methyltransferase